MTNFARLTALGFFVGIAGCTSSLMEGAGNMATDVKEGAEAALSDSGGGCGATQRADLVGQSVTVLNDAELPETARVLFPGAAVSQEVNPGRLNIAIGTDDRITQVYCG